MKTSASLSVPIRLLHTPLMITPAAADAMLSVLNGSPIATREETGAPAGPQTRAAAPRTLSIPGERPSAGPATIAVISVLGCLIYRGYGWFWETSYLDIRKALRQALADTSIDAVLFDFDSHGGEVAGAFDLIDEIHASRGRKPLYAIANEACFSAAYGIASACDKVLVTRTANVGSIGVIAIHAEQSQWEKNTGITYTAIFAGERKNDFSTHEPLSAPAHQVAKKSVERCRDLFVATVARNRSMTEKAVLATEAACYEGADAVAAGLADAVVSWDEAIALIGEEITTHKGGNAMDLATLETDMKSILADSAQAAAATAALAALGFVPAAEAPPPQPSAEALAAAKKEGETAAAARVTAVLEICSLAGRFDMASALIAAGKTAEEARSAIIEAQALAAAGAGITSTLGSLSDGARNPLIEDAKKRAAKPSA